MNILINCCAVFSSGSYSVAFSFCASMSSRQFFSIFFHECNQEVWGRHWWQLCFSTTRTRQRTLAPWLLWRDRRDSMFCNQCSICSRKRCMGTFARHLVWIGRTCAQSPIYLVIQCDPMWSRIPDPFCAQSTPIRWTRWTRWTWWTRGMRWRQAQLA